MAFFIWIVAADTTATYLAWLLDKEICTKIAKSVQRVFA
jgi:hypothetical protein